MNSPLFVINISDYTHFTFWDTFDHFHLHKILGLKFMIDGVTSFKLMASYLQMHNSGHNQTFVCEDFASSFDCDIILFI